MILQVCPSMYLSVQIQLKAKQKSLDKEIVQQWHIGGWQMLVDIL